MPAAYLRVLASAERTIRTLRPHLVRNAAPKPPLPTAVSLPRRALFAFGLLGLGLAFARPNLMEPGVAGPLAWWNPAAWAPETVWHRLLGV